MPTYQYACTACEERLEVVQSFTDDPLTECPNCGGRLRKVFSAAGIIFKGSGFYRTDSRSTAKSGASGSAKKSDADGSDSAKSESKSSTSTKSSGDTGTSSSSSTSYEKVA